MTPEPDSVLSHAAHFGVVDVSAMVEFVMVRVERKLNINREIDRWQGMSIKE